MKKFSFPLSAIVLIVVTIFLTGCPKPEKECECCVNWGSTEKNVVNSNGELVSLKVPSAFTPSNLKFCDSNVYVNGILSDNGCRKNADSIYNDNLNDKFQIIGIEKFPENDLLIRVPGDTTTIDHFVNFKNSTGRSFNGIKIDTTLYGNERQRQLTSGRYMFILQLYKDSVKVHTKANRIDSISGYFCIIRNKDFCNVNCEGKDAGDQLIK